MIKHPLVKKEWKSLRWIMFVFSIFFTAYAVTLNDNITLIKDRYLLNDFVDTIFMYEAYRVSTLMVPVMLIGITILVVFLFSHDRNLSVGKFISSLPFSRKLQFKIKYIMGLITFTLPFILFGVVTIVMRMKNEKWISHLYKYASDGEILTKQDSLGALVLWLGIVWLIMLAVYSFLMLVQTLMGQNIIAGVIGAITYLVPWYLIIAIAANAQFIFDQYWPVSQMVSEGFLFTANPMTIIQRTSKGVQSLYVNLTDAVIYEYRNLGINLGILLMIIIISTLLAHYFFQSNDVEKNGDIVMYPWVGKLLIAGVTICSLLLLPIIVVIFTQIGSKIVLLGSMAIGGILGYIISSKSIEINQRHG